MLAVIKPCYVLRTSMCVRESMVFLSKEYLTFSPQHFDENCTVMNSESALCIPQTCQVTRIRRVTHAFPVKLQLTRTLASISSFVRYRSLHTTLL